MKTIKNSLIAILALVAVSCNFDDVEDRPVVAGTDAPVLEAPEDGNTYVLNPDNMDDLAERFVWSAANFGEGVIPQYAVEIDYSGDNFDTPFVIGNTDGTLQLAATENVLNSALLSLGATPFEAASFQVRVKASVGENVLYSNAVELFITPYTTEAPSLYVVGNFAAASGYGNDWDPASGVEIKAPAYGTTNFEGYIFLNVGAPELKLLPMNTGWDGDYGMSPGNPGVLAQDGEDNITAPAAGYYKIQADTGEAMSYSLTATNWGLIGSATPGGWDADQDMTYDPVTMKWSITVNLVAGEMKFRANDAWTLNYGDNGADGSLEQDGSNIAIAAAGSYTITLDLHVSRQYTYTVTAN